MRRGGREDVSAFRQRHSSSRNTSGSKWIAAEDLVKLLREGAADIGWVLDVGEAVDVTGEAVDVTFEEVAALRLDSRSVRSIPTKP